MKWAFTFLKIAPEDSFSIDVYFEAEKLFNQNKIDPNRSSGFDTLEYIFGLHTSYALEYVINKFLQMDKNTIHSFLEHYFSDTHEKQIKELFENITNALNDTLCKLLKQFLLKLRDEDFYHNDACEVFTRLIINVLIKDNEKYLEEVLEELVASLNNEKIYHWVFLDFVALNLSPFIMVNNFDIIYAILKKIEHKNLSFLNVMLRLFYTETLDINVKEKIGLLHRENIEKCDKENEEYLKKQVSKEQNLCDKWLYKIESEPDQFQTDLFSFFLSHKDALMQCQSYEVNRQRMVDIAQQIFLNNNPLKGGFKRNTPNTSTLSQIPFLRKCIKFLYEEKIVFTDQTMIDNAFRYLPFNINAEYKSTFELAPTPSSKALQDVIDVYAGKRKDDLDTYSPRNFVQMYQNLRIKEAEPLLLKMIQNENIELYIREEIVDILPPIVLTKKRIDAMRRKPELENNLKKAFLKALVTKHHDKKAFNEVIECVKQTAIITSVPDGKDSVFMTELDDHRGQNSLNELLIHHEKYTKAIDEDFLVLASSLRKEERHVNAEFLEKIVNNHLKQLRHLGSFEPIYHMQNFMLRNQNELELGSFEYGFNEAKNSYLEAIAKPSNMVEALKAYKKFKDKSYLPIASSFHLLEVIKSVIEKDLKRWVEDEGAYKQIKVFAQKKENLNAEEFISKTLMPQIKLALYEHGFRATDFRLHREEQLMDDKRIDYTISYGFIGQILLELKLDSNSEAKKGKDAQEYVAKLQKYIQGSHSDYGIFLIFNIRSSKEDFEKQLQNLHELYKDELNINVMGLNCKID